MGPVAAVKLAALALWTISVIWTSSYIVHQSLTSGTNLLTSSVLELPMVSGVTHFLGKVSHNPVSSFERLKNLSGTIPGSPWGTLQGPFDSQEEVGEVVSTPLAKPMLVSETSLGVVPPLSSPSKSVSKSEFEVPFSFFGGLVITWVQWYLVSLIPVTSLWRPLGVSLSFIYWLGTWWCKYPKWEQWLVPLYPLSDSPGGYQIKK